MKLYVRFFLSILLTSSLFGSHLMAQNAGLSISTFKNLGPSGIRSNWLPIEGKLYSADLQKFRLVVKNTASTASSKVLVTVALISKVGYPTHILYIDTLAPIGPGDSLIIKKSKDLTRTSVTRPIDFGGYDNDSSSLNLQNNSLSDSSWYMEASLWEINNQQTAFAEKRIEFTEIIQPFTAIENATGFNHKAIEVMTGQAVVSQLKIKDVGSTMPYHPFQFTRYPVSIYLSDDSLADPLDTKLPLDYQNSELLYSYLFFTMKNSVQYDYRGPVVTSNIYHRLPSDLPLGKEYYLIFDISGVDVTSDTSRNNKVSFYKIKIGPPKIDVKLTSVVGHTAWQGSLHFTPIVEQLTAITPESLNYKLYISDDTLIDVSDINEESRPLANTGLGTASINYSLYSHLNASKNIIIKMIGVSLAQEIDYSNQVKHFRMAFGSAPVSSSLSLSSVVMPNVFSHALDLELKIVNQDSNLSITSFQAYYSLDSLFSSSDIPHEEPERCCIVTHPHSDTTFYTTLPNIDYSKGNYVLLVLKSMSGEEVSPQDNVVAMKMNKIAALGVEDEAINRSVLHLYPNPTTGKLSTSLPEGCTNVEVVGMDQTVAFSTPISGQRNLDMDLSALPKGVYVVKSIGKDIHFQKVIVQ